MFEFMIPQPSQLHRYGIKVATGAVDTVLDGEEPIKPIDPSTIGLTNAGSLTAFNYISLASRYGADVETMPPTIITTGKSYRGEAGDSGSTSEYNELKGA